MRKICPRQLLLLKLGSGNEKTENRHGSRLVQLRLAKISQTTAKLQPTNSKQVFPAAESLRGIYDTTSQQEKLVNTASEEEQGLNSHLFQLSHH